MTEVCVCGGVGVGGGDCDVLHTFATHVGFFMTSLIPTAGYRMAALTVVFSQL